MPHFFFAKPKAKSNYFVFWRWSWRKCFSLSFHFSHPHINCCYQSYLNFSFSYLFIAFSFRTRAYDDVLCFVAKMPRFSRITNAKKWNNTFKAELHKKAAKFLMRIFPTPAYPSQERGSSEMCEIDAVEVPNACNNHHKKRIKIICTFKINFKLETNFMSNFPAKFPLAQWSAHIKLMIAKERTNLSFHAPLVRFCFLKRQKNNI